MDSNSKEYQEARDQIAVLIKEAQAKLAEAEDISDKSGVGFTWNYEYGMGGYYTPRKGIRPENTPDADWESSDEGGWNSSSSNC